MSVGLNFGHEAEFQENLPALLCLLLVYFSVGALARYGRSVSRDVGAAMLDADENDER